MEYEFAEHQQTKTEGFSTVLTTRKFVGVELAWAPHQGAQSENLSSISQNRKKMRPQFHPALLYH